jgi:pimeloyl-ACP methyl ester carboxylesterase
MIRRTLLLLALAASALPSTAPAQKPDLTGTWAGRWDRDGSALEVEIAFTRADTGYSGSLSAAQLRAVGIPLTRIRYEAPRASWALVGDATTSLFEGALKGDSLSGTIRENGDAGTFRLARQSSAAAAIREEEITFRNGDVTLGGTVVFPAGPGPHPGVVFLHGSGAEGRWGSRYLANTFARQGIAALIYDKRGVGASMGDWRQAGFEDLVGDAVAAVQALRARAGIDSARVGIHGHSQGGTYAPWVAAESPRVAFVIGSAASGVSMADAERYSLANSVGMSGLPEKERALAERYVNAVVATAYEGAPRAALDSAYQAVRGRTWAFELPPESSHYWTFSRRIASYRPLEYWARVTAPALLVYGDRDQRVPPRESAARIADAYFRARGTRLDVRLFAGADHTFRVRPAGTGKFEWPRSAPGYPDAIFEWIRYVTGAR